MAQSSVLALLLLWLLGAAVAAASAPPPPKPQDLVSNWNAGCTFNLTGRGPRLGFPFCNSCVEPPPTPRLEQRRACEV